MTESNPAPAPGRITTSRSTAMAALALVAGLTLVGASAAGPDSTAPAAAVSGRMATSSADADSVAAQAPGASSAPAAIPDAGAPAAQTVASGSPSLDTDHFSAEREATAERLTYAGDDRNSQRPVVITAISKLPPATVSSESSRSGEPATGTSPASLTEPGAASSAPPSPAVLQWPAASDPVTA